MSWIITGAEKTPVDLNFSNVSLLLHGNGVNGSTTITDSSPSPKTVTAVGNAQISTAQNKFSGASLLFDGTNDWLNLNSAASPDASASFTIECFIYPNAVTGSDRVIFECRSTTNSASTGFVFFINAETRLQVYGNSGVLYGSSSSGVSLGSSAGFQHVALVCSGNTWAYYIGGLSAGSFTATPTTPLNTRIGARQDGAAGYNGYIDDLRITKGIARYTANFTPPTAPFPDI
jgi:hypothetical protein